MALSTFSSPDMCVVGLIGLILFTVAAKKYKYRAWNEGMFRQVDNEDTFKHVIEQASVNTAFDNQCSAI